MKFSILTIPLTLKENILYNLKNIIKIFLNIKTYGPNSVIESIKLGLKDLGNNEYNINPSINKINNIVFVPNGIETLKSTIKLKQKGLIKTIIAGPNISIPFNKKDIIFNKNIDTIIVPSNWVKNYFLNLKPEENRINIRATGVNDSGFSLKSSNKIIIYKKSCSEKLFQSIINNLKKLKINFEIIGYGNFSKKEYYKKLDNCIGMIYLQESESQGLALHEAWIKDIPTLVWNRGYWEYKGIKWNDKNISAPYLNDKCGIFFEGINDFKKQFDIFYKNINNFEARKYSLDNFTNKITTKILISIINKNESNK